MFVRIHGFDWVAYNERVMPAFSRWLIDGDDSAVGQLYQETRSAKGEQFVPDAVKHLCIWPRAQAFVKQLPRGRQARHEYRNLCAPELFTALSDRYIRHYPPRLYQDSEALRSVWGAIVEQFCLPWFHLSSPAMEAEPDLAETEDEGAIEAESSELVTLLESAGLEGLAQQFNEQLVKKGDPEQSSIEESAELEIESDDDREAPDDDTGGGPRGIIIGRQPATLHIRGWLAAISVRSMVHFEFLACGRRAMPFGYQAGEPFESYIGYLTPDEIWQVALLLGDVQPPDPAKAREDARNFRDQLSEQWDEFRLVDEILPEHGMELLQAIHSAAHQGLGLICSIY